MKSFYLFNEENKAIGRVYLINDVADSLGLTKPDLRLSYAWDIENPGEIMSFGLIIEPVNEHLKVPEIEDEKPKCGARKAAGWGSATQICTFEPGHEKQGLPHSWVIQ